eukprot:TRINITY_DN2829_c0_g1_i2.p1 TRINITY_DN2829_c0_g1~~TRINITY_DN2829_c0_g1_i2.p1  ORF type:complete len:228 (+),score=91.85 TRINITY_DN2829_c0_g1_i2:3-686(+)
MCIRESIKAEYMGLFFFFKQKTAYEIMPSLVGSEMCIRDSPYIIKRYNPDEWFAKDKKILPITFPNLPYLYADGQYITESEAIIQWIVNTAGRPELLGKTLLDQVSVSTYRNVINDFQMQIVRASGGSDAQAVQAALMKVLTEKGTPFLINFDKLLAGKTYIMGDYITWIDLVLFFTLELVIAINPDVLANDPNLVRLHKTIRNLPSIDAYYKSDRCNPRPFYNQHI